jgi:hypothetical protein
LTITPDDRPELAGLASLMAELRSVHDDASGPGRRVAGPGLCTRLVLAQAVDHGPLGLKPGAKTGRSP